MRLLFYFADESSAGFTAKIEHFLKHFTKMLVSYCQWKAGKVPPFADVGWAVGLVVGAGAGTAVGSIDGDALGSADGDTVGSADDDTVGSAMWVQTESEQHKM